MKITNEQIADLLDFQYETQSQSSEAFEKASQKDKFVIIKRYINDYLSNIALTIGELSCKLHYGDHNARITQEIEGDIEHYVYMCRRYAEAAYALSPSFVEEYHSPVS
tara:strand:- start:43 stop:366 length:324 start_codon:yes stop_codon:yes gene_type:complete